jgi:MinD-like ATPase involved in chromosome partitioning or flagellar assembly
MTEGSVVTFYSYKGGVGRTFALASIGASLTKWGYKVLCIDWDLEAPGLHLYFEPWVQDPNQPGLVELIETYIGGDSCPWQNFVTEVHFPDAQEPLMFMSAGRQDESYVRRMQALSWPDLYGSYNLGKFLEDRRSEWKQEFDFVLIDSRTGITDIGGICTVQLPDFLVLLFTANHQNLNGAYNVINLARKQRDSLPFDRAKLLVLPVITRFEGRVEYETAQEWLEIINRKLEPLYLDWSDRTIDSSDLLNFTRIPYVPYWSFGERIPVLEEDTKDPESAAYAMETLAAMVALKLSNTDTLVSNRDQLVSTAKRGPARRLVEPEDEVWRNSASSIKLFLSYSHRDQSFVDELMKHLTLLQRQGVIDVFYDREIRIGSEWANEISIALEEAQIILLLISSDFLSSDYAYDREVRRAIVKHDTGESRVLPIILRPVNFEGSPLERMQVLPNNGQPISLWSNQDEAWLNVVDGIRGAITHLQREKISSSTR